MKPLPKIYQNFYGKIITDMSKKEQKKRGMCSTY